MKQNMKNYTKAQIKECKDYLGYSVKEGYLDEDVALDLIRTKNWDEVYHIMDMGDYYANQKPEEAGCEADDFIK